MINSQLLASSLWSLVSLVAPPQQSSAAAPATAPSYYSDLQSDQNTLASTLSQRVQQILDDHHARGEFPGAVIALRLASGTELLLTSGKQDTSDTAAAVDAAIPWCIGSATKSFVAVTILQLAQEGSLELDQTVEAWLPSIPWASSITARQLLQHTSGLADYVHMERVLSDAKRSWTADELLDVAVARGPVPGQGKQHFYSNTNYLALGLIMEAVTGKAWFEEVRARILKPLSLKQTGYWGAPTAPSLGTGHCMVHGKFVDRTDRWHPTLGGAAGGMYSTAGDMVRFGNALRAGDLLNEQSQLQMRSFIPAELDEGVKQEYGLGMQRYTFDGLAMSGHLGTASAHSCFFGFDPKSGASIAVLVNRENGVPAGFMASEVLRAAATESPASPQVPRPTQRPMPRPAPRKGVCDEPKADAVAQFRRDFLATTADRLDAVHIPGLAVAVVRPDGRTWTHGFGYANQSTGARMTADSVMRIASLSKMVTATAAMQAVENGSLSLDEDINLKLPFSVVNPHHPDDPITLRQLLTHTSSIADSKLYKTPVVFHFGGDHPQALGDFLKQYLTPNGEHYSAAVNFLKAAPGVQAGYSNVAFGLIGYLLETVTATPFNELTRKSIIEPLGMDSSGWRLDRVEVTTLQYGSKDGPFADLMTGEPSGPWRAYMPYGAVTYPDGGLLTSVNDFSRFMITIMNGGTFGETRILGVKTVKAMLTPQDLGDANGERLANEGRYAQALGFAYLALPGTAQGGIRIGHRGGDPGTIATVYFDPITEICVIAFMNSDSPGKAARQVYYETLQSLFDNANELIGE